MLRHLPFVLGLLALGPAAAAHQIKIETQPDGTSVAAPTFKLAAGRPALVAGLDRLQPLVREEADAVVHLPTGVRLPRVHGGCRLAVVFPLGPAGRRPGGYAAGALAEYDCTPSDGLAQVELSFERGSATLRKEGLAKGVRRVAFAATEQRAEVGRSECTEAGLSTIPRHAGLMNAYCGVRWSDPREAPPRQYGVGTVALGRGDSFVRFTRTCLGAQCDAGLKAFGEFVSTFDLDGFRAAADVKSK